MNRRRFWGMKWENWTKAQLRTYLCRQIDLARIDEELARLEDVEPRIANYNPSPSKKAPYRKHSVLEFSAGRREKGRDFFENRRNWILEQVKIVESGLNSLTEFHRLLIEMSYLSLDYPTDKNIAEKLNIPKWQVAVHKRAALSHLFDTLLL
jgi:hypothetical protein